VIFADTSAAPTDRLTARTGRAGSAFQAAVTRWPYGVVTIAMIYAWHATLKGSAHIPFDLEFFHFPLLRTVQQMITSGTLPSWDPYTYGGVPLLANAQSAFAYPPHLLLTAWFAISGGSLSNHLLGSLSVIHVWIAGMGTVLLVRGRGWGDPAAAFAGSFVSLCGFVVAESQHLGMAEALAWLPLAAVFVDRCAACVSFGRVAGVGAMFFLALSSGFLPMVIPWVMVLLAMAVARTDGRARAAAGASVGVMFGLLLGAVMLLPIYALGDYFPALERYNTHTLATLVTSIYPDAFGHLVAPAMENTVKYAIGDYMYIGGGALLLLPVALARGRRVLPEAAVALAILVLSIGPIGERVAHGIQALPQFGVLYRPGILLYTGVLPISLLLARGLQCQPSRRALGLAALVVVSLAVVPISDSQGHVLRLVGSAPRRELLMVVVGGIALVVASWSRVAPRCQRLAMVMFAIAATGELASTIPSRFFTNSPGPGTTVASTGDGDVVAWIHEHSAPDQRVAIDAVDLSAQWFGFSPLFRLQNVNGFQPQFSRFQQARVNMEATGESWQRSVGGAASLGNRVLPVTPDKTGYFREMGVRYVISPVTSDRFHGVKGYIPVLHADDVVIYEIPHPSSRAWILAPSCVPEAEQGELRNPGCVTASVKTAILSPQRRSYSLSWLSSRQLLITGEPYYPGWHAQTGRGALTVRRLGYLAAVTVPPKVRTLTLSYSPPGLVPGLIISLSSLFVASGVGLARQSRRRRQPSGGRADVSAPRPASTPS
jgi:hypothetical protein